MCLLCANGIDRHGDAGRRLHVLQLLALVEHPDGLPPDAALRLSREIIAIIDRGTDRLRCDPAAPRVATGEKP